MAVDESGDKLREAMALMQISPIEKREGVDQLRAPALGSATQGRKLTAHINGKLRPPSSEATSSRSSILSSEE